jgi:pilus assembly protein CpaD
MRTSVKAFSRTAILGSLAVSAVLMAGCAKRDHIQVGSIPDDYRTRHPIIIAENQKSLMVPVGNAARELSFAEKEVISGFIANYGTQGSGAIHISVPAGAGHAGAAGHAANQVMALAHAQGHGGRTLIDQYQASPDHPSPPVVVSYGALTASAGPCGKWPADALATEDNKQYHNFGCAYQNNLAAQVANPMDLLHPRRTGPIDAADRDTVIGDYRTATGTWSPSIDY